ncbi:hypothetical protein A4A49_09759 [Nicotiana attenuata]|uniref:Uncharacterized protein n=1 Tax=Nicotiana attenuata TaxID=49451 RepID=A0A314LGU3_NICAT|nr:hypothetical protein A4A49_09759 [Nicotiana attenuata]
MEATGDRATDEPTYKSTVARLGPGDGQRSDVAGNQTVNAQVLLSAVQAGAFQQNKTDAPVLNTSDDRLVSKIGKSTAASTQSAGLHAEATDALKEGVKSDNIAEKKAENWTMVSSKKGSPNNTNVQQLEQKQGVVNRSSNKRSSGVKEQAKTPKNIEFSNSFDALRNEQEHVMNKEGKSIQHVLMDEPISDDIATTTQQRDHEAASKSGRPKSPESPEQQIFSQHTGATSAIGVHRKTWAERVQEEKEDYADNIHDDSDNEAAQQRCKASRFLIPQIAGQSGED